MIGKKEIILGLGLHFFLLVSMSKGIVFVVEAGDKALSETNQHKNNSSSDITPNINNTFTNSQDAKNVPVDDTPGDSGSGNTPDILAAPQAEQTLGLVQEENSEASSQNTQLANAAKKELADEKRRGWFFGALKDTACKFTSMGCDDKSEDENNESQSDNAEGVPDIRLPSSVFNNAGAVPDVRIGLTKPENDTHTNNITKSNTATTGTSK